MEKILTPAVFAKTHQLFLIKETTLAGYTMQMTQANNPEFDKQTTLNLM